MAETQMDWHNLQKMKVDNLRELAEKIPGAVGYLTMKKEQLLDIVADHLEVQRPRRVISGIEKSHVKQAIRVLKKERDQAELAHDHKELKRVRRAIHRKKRTLRQAAALR